MPKRVPSLTAASIAKLKPHPTRTVEVVDGAVPGLRLRVTSSNTRTWSLNIRANGVMRRFDVGRDLGLAEARKRAEAIRQRVKDGADPTAERRARRREAVAAKSGIGSFEAVINEYFTTGNGVGLKTKVEQLRRIQIVFKALLVRPAMSIVSADLQRAIDGHKAKVAAARAVGYVSPAIVWAIRRGLMQGAFDIEKPITNAPRQRVLTIAEVGRLVPTLTEGHGKCCLLLLLTGARREEACAATWGQIDLERRIWTVPGADRKDTRGQAKRNLSPNPPLTIPLSRQATALLEDVLSAEKSRRRASGDERPVASSDWVFVGSKGKRLSNWNRWVKSNSKKSGVEGWSPHALRRTVATLAGDIGAPPHIVSVLLGHKNIGGQLVAGYNKSRYQSEHLDALQRLADLVCTVAAEGNVVTLSRRGA